TSPCAIPTRSPDLPTAPVRRPSRQRPQP
ncbi:MAG: hypothetical protein AVDCRST_MAG30-1450, partial [uncultured Solirubrobacteraceae bacterium]